ncbi:hypothetical protein F66182_322 [Fusarium sp. NRRL 66182]|nr:hypothetical protein F66182_322 [Fusarium sp. NRRL 66182]
MDSPLAPQEGEENQLSREEVNPSASQEAAMNNNSSMQRHPHANSRTPEPQVERQPTNSDTPDTPDVLEPFDWDEFEARYEAALRDADEQEREILNEADALSKYFKVWAATASAHDDERAAKRLQTRRRFVNISEERMERKQEHYDQVVRAFENALALLRSQRVRNLEDPNLRLKTQFIFGIFIIDNPFQPNLPARIFHPYSLSDELVHAVQLDTGT